MTVVSGNGQHISRQLSVYRADGFQTTIRDAEGIAAVLLVVEACCAGIWCADVCCITSLCCAVLCCAVRSLQQAKSEKLFFSVMRLSTDATSVGYKHDRLM